jgi:beta-galactosidase/beta-glucuronidase
MLEACDFYGMYVMDESFDTWYKRKTAFDYGLDFEKEWANDITAMVEKDFNHPSVILYSIGNEVGEPAEAKGLEMAKAQIDLCHELDDSRPVTCGTNLMIMVRAGQGKSMYKDGAQTTGNIKQKEGTGEAKNASLAFNIVTSYLGTMMNKAGKKHTRKF